MELYVRALAEGSLGQSFLLLGPASSAAEALARSAARTLLCRAADRAHCGRCPDCRQDEAGTHPDLEILDGAGEEGAAESLRERVQSFLSLSPVGPRKVLVLLRVGELSGAAQDALLKPIEEPPPGAILILTAEDPRSLRETVRSRCRILRLSAPCFPGLREMGEGLSVGLAFLEEGRPREPGALFRRVLGGKRPELALRRERVRRFLRGFAELLRAALRLGSGAELPEGDGGLPADSLPRLREASRRWSPEQLERLLERTAEALGDLRAQVSPELALETLFLSPNCDYL